MLALYKIYGWCMYVAHCSYNSCKSSIKGLEVFTIMHLSSTPGRAQVGIIGDLQESFDKFPTPGDTFMLQIPYILYRDSKNNENSWTNAPTLGTKYVDKSLQIPTHCPIWGRWGLTVLGALYHRVLDSHI